MKQTAQEIYSAVADGRLKEPFTAAEIMTACPSMNAGTAATFPHKHSKDNSKSKETKWFKCSGSRGEHETIRPGWNEWIRIFPSHP